MSTLPAPVRSITRTVILATLLLIAAAPRATADDGADGACGAVVLTQSIGTVPIANASAWCEVGFVQTANGYMRVFDLPAVGINDPFEICEIRFGIEFAGHPTGSQVVTVNVYALTGPLLLQNLTLVASQGVTIFNQAGTIVGVPISVDVPAGATFVVEIFAPAAPGSGFGFVMGSNPSGQTAPSYLVAPACGIGQPTDTAILGVPNVQWLMWVDGDPVPAGACCFFDGTCDDGVTETTCVALGGLSAVSQTCAGGACVELCGETNLTQSTRQTADGVSSFACAPGGFHGDSSYFRIFDLAAEGITVVYDVCEVQFGVQSASSAAGTQPVTVNLYTLDGAFEFANLILYGTATVDVGNSGATMVTVPVAAAVPANAQLVVEIFTPSGAATSANFRMGSNDGGQTAPSYWAAPECETPEPVDLATIGLPTIHWIINVSGEADFDVDDDGVLDGVDNCELFNPDQRDCDGNGIGDVCDIDAGEPDCNLDTVPDACQDDPTDGFALTLDGGDDGVVGDPPAEWIGNTSITIEYWIRHRPQPDRMWIMDVGPRDTYNNIFFALDTNGHVDAGFFSGTKNAFNLAVYEDTWTHVATVYDSSALTLRSYINGDLVDDDPVTGVVNLQPTAGQLRLAVLAFTELPFRGDLDEVRIWNVARTQGEIQADRFEALTGTEPGLVTLFPLDDGSGATAAELAQGNDATVNGGAFWFATARDADGNGVPDTCEACPEDLTGDGDVGFGDILDVIANWGPCAPGPCPADLNGNGAVDFADILAIIAAWGPCE
ncbi:MAG: LamG-like jellyroll fold domain-containing protein [Planctomycetota bacterium]|jgi:hypothetical protein